MESQEENTDEEKPARMSKYLLLSIFSSCLGMFTYGYNMSVLNNTQATMKAFYNATHVSRTGVAMPDNTLTLLWAFTVAIFAVGGMIGGFIGGWWADKLGRKKGLLVNTVFGITAGLLMGLSKVAGSFELIIIARFIIGFYCGLATVICPLYNSEISPVRLRGAIGTLNQMASNLGIITSQILGLDAVLGNDHRWPVILSLMGLPSLLQVAVLPLCPESPRYLLMIKNQENHAVQALKKLRGKGYIISELKELNMEQEHHKDVEKMGILKLLKSQPLRKPLILSILMHLSRQLTGFLAVVYYSRALFEGVGMTRSVASYATLAIGGTLVVMTLLTIPLMDRLGRRPLHLAGLAGMFIFSIMFTVASAMQNRISAMGYVSVVSSLLFTAFFAIGPASIPWMIVAELFSQAPRPAAVSISILINWASNFVVAQSFPPIQNMLKHFALLPFTVIIAIFFGVLYKLLPETKNKTITEITALFEEDNKLFDVAGSKVSEIPYTQTSGTYKQKPRTDI